MFSYISMNWRGTPLVTHEIIVNLIADTTTEHGLRIKSALDEGTYPKGEKFSDEQIDSMVIKRSTFHGDWNYSLLPVTNA